MANLSAKAKLGSLEFCKGEIDRMIANSQTKLIMPVVTYGLLGEYGVTGQTVFTDDAIRKIYESAVRKLISFLGHDVHLGAKYYDAYASRMSRYGVLKTVEHLRYKLARTYADNASDLCTWIPSRIKAYIDLKLGVVPQLDSAEVRFQIAAEKLQFLQVIESHISKSPANFEIFSFAVLKVHLERFACRIYRDTRTASHDGGVDLATNFGVVYQVKKLQILNEADARRLYSELKLNFDHQRLQDGNVIVVIDDISKDIRDYLIQMRVQSISKADVLSLAKNFEEAEDRQKVLRVIYEEFRREYSNRIRPSPARDRGRRHINSVVPET